MDAHNQKRKQQTAEGTTSFKNNGKMEDCNAPITANIYDTIDAVQPFDLIG